MRRHKLKIHQQVVDTQATAAEQTTVSEEGSMEWLGNWREDEHHIAEQSMKSNTIITEESSVDLLD
jgi:hypothetical protein